MSKRPNYFDDDIARKVARKFLVHLTKWTEGYGTAAELENELSDAITRTAPQLDGYAIAHYLERRYQWASDSELVDILGSVAVEADSVLSEAVAEWVKANGIRPKRVIGNMVDVKRRPTDRGHDQLKGEIIAIDEEQAKYSVFVAERGHVRSGPGIHADILPFEDFHELATAPEEFALMPQ